MSFLENVDVKILKIKIRVMCHNNKHKSDVLRKG